MLKGMKGQMRCCIATIGDAAAADASLYQNLYGTVLIWLGTDVRGIACWCFDLQSCGVCCDVL